MKYDFSDVKFILADNWRARLGNNIIIADVFVVNDMPVMLKGTAYSYTLGDYRNTYYYLHKIGELDFLQEINGFFHSRDKVYLHSMTLENFAKEYVPDDVEIKTTDGYAAGDYVVDNDFNVYRITGWDNQNNSEHYFDFVDGDGAIPLHKDGNTITNM